MSKDEGHGNRTKPVQENCCRTHLRESLHQIHTGKKVIKPADKREAVEILIKKQQCSISKACKIVQLPQSSYQYKKKSKDDSEIQDALTEVVSKYPAIGLWQSYHWFRNRGKKWNHKQVRRIYREMKLNVRRRAKKLLPERIKQPLVIPIAPDQT